MKGIENFLINFYCVLILLKVYFIIKNCVLFYGGFDIFLLVVGVLESVEKLYKL